MPLDRVPRLIEGPAAAVGLLVEEGLAEAIARDVESPEALPLLAHTLWLLHRHCMSEKKLSFAKYQSLGDPQRGLNPIQNSVRLVADQAIGGLKPSDAELAALRDAFVPHLVRVRLNDGARVRQPAQMSELPPESLRLVRALVQARLLTTRGADDHAPAPDGGDAVVEASHEALFKAWPLLDQWLTEEREFLTDIERIKIAQDIWTQAPEDQKSSALLGGLLLSRARDWLGKHPQRFRSGDTAAVGQFIAASAAAEDAERARAEAEQAKVRRLERRMFQGAMDFWYQRTALQAFGWYLVFFLLGLPLASLTGFIFGRGSATTFSEGYQSGQLPGQIFGVVYVVFLGGLLLWKRQKGALNIGLYILGVALSLFIGMLGGLIPLAVLTTRPSTTSK